MSDTETSVKTLSEVELKAMLNQTQINKKKEKKEKQKRKKSNPSSDASSNGEHIFNLKQLAQENLELKKKLEACEKIIKEYAEKFYSENSSVNNSDMEIEEDEADNDSQRADTLSLNSENNNDAVPTALAYGNKNKKLNNNNCDAMSPAIDMSARGSMRNNNNSGALDDTKANGNSRTPAVNNNDFPLLGSNRKVKAAKVVSTTAPANKKNNKNNKKGLPPIFVCYNVNEKELTLSLFNVLKHKNFSFNLLNKNVMHVMTCTMEDYSKVKIYLKEREFKFYTYTPNELKPHSILINKLSTIYEEAEIIEYIKDLKLNINILKISKFYGDKWLIQLSHASDLKEFKSIKYILNCKVSFENFRPQLPTQCKNCQRFTHVASNCSMPYRCVKCGEPHGPGNCKLPPKESNNKETSYTDPITGQLEKRIGIPVHCVNCNADGHTANAKNCPKRLEILKKLKEKTAKKTVNHQFAKQSFSTANRGSESYASKAAGAFKTGSPTGNMTQNFIQFDTLNEEFNRLIGKNMFQCLEQVKLFSAQYKTLRSDEEKTKALFNLLISLRLDG